MNHMTAAQAAQQNNRDNGGRYATKEHAEVPGVDLDAGGVEMHVDEDGGRLVLSTLNGGRLVLHQGDSDFWAEAHADNAVENTGIDNPSQEFMDDMHRAVIENVDPMANEDVRLAARALVGHLPASRREKLERDLQEAPMPRHHEWNTVRDITYSNMVDATQNAPTLLEVNRMRERFEHLQADLAGNPDASEAEITEALEAMRELRSAEDVRLGCIRGRANRQRATRLDVQETRQMADSAAQAAAESRERNGDDERAEAMTAMAKRAEMIADEVRTAHYREI